MARPNSEKKSDPPRARRASGREISLWRDGAIDFPPLAPKVRERGATECATENAVALAVAAEIGVERRPAQRVPGVHELDEANELAASSILDERHADFLVKSPTQPTWSGRQALRERGRRERRVLAGRFEGSTTENVRTARTLDVLREEVRKARFNGVPITHVTETGQGIRRREQLGRGKWRSATRRERSKSDGTLGELGSQRQHEELEVRARSHELVILSRLEDDHFAGGKAKRAVPGAENAAPGDDHVDFRLVVEMPGPPVRRLVTPDLSAPPRKHRKGLKQRRHAVIEI